MGTIDRPRRVEEAIDDNVDLVTMVHNETSTGLLNPVEEVGELAAEYDARFLVDGVTSIGGDEFRIDDWNVDVAVTDAQKALAAPPGISALYVAERATDSDVVFGGEPSGAWIWPDKTLCPDGPFAACRPVELVSQKGPLYGSLTTSTVFRSVAIALKSPIKRL